MSFDNWSEGLTEVCTAFQADLSCLVDGELHRGASDRAMLHMESCTCCSQFVEATRRQVQMNRDVADPDRLLARVAMLTGNDLAAEAAEFDLNHRLATIFYELGKAYALAGIDPDAFRERVFRRPVPVATTKTRGRGFVDGVLLGGTPASSGVADSDVNWQRARHLLNGQLEKIDAPLDKGRRLLEEAVAIDRDHEEARHYLALLHKADGRTLRAAEGFRDVFDTALDLTNRVHAAINLGRAYYDEGETKKALVFWRWTLAFGDVSDDERFWFVRYNVALAYILEQDGGRAVASLRSMLDRFPVRAADVARMLSSGSPKIRMAIESQVSLTRALLKDCPELFLATAAQDEEGPEGVKS